MPTVGSRIGPYLLESVLGSGGIAQVFRARAEDGTRIALKVLHADGLGTDEVKRFEREYRALTRLHHPNVVRVLETGRLGSVPWIAMELVEGSDLDAVLEDWRFDPPPDRWTRVERILRGVCRALDHVHAHGMIHRDLKPANILIDTEGEPHLSDFGVVKDNRSDTTQLTQHGNLVGTIAFMAPEQIMDEALDARTDLYALGAVLYVMLTGRRPIEADSVTAYLTRHLSHTPAAPSTLMPGVPRHLEAVCQRLLYKEMGQRYPSATAVLTDLEAGNGLLERPLRGRDALLARLRERWARLSGGVGGLVVLIGGPGSGRSAALQAGVRLAREGGVAVASVAGTSRNLIGGLWRVLAPDAPEEPSTAHLRLLAQTVRGRPTLLAIDDIDKATPAMIDALARLLRKLVGQEVESLCVFVAVERRTASLDALFASTDVEEEVLGPVDPEALAALMRDRGAKGAVAKALGRRFAADLMGRPAAAVQALQALIDAGWLRSSGDSLLAERPPDVFAREPLPLPSLGRADVLARLERLDPDARAVAEALALGQEPVETSLLVSVVDAPAGASAALIEVGLCAESGEGFRFDHPFARSTLQATLDPTRARVLHGAWARALDRLRRRGLAEDIARHFEAAAEFGEAYAWWIQAARAYARERQPTRTLIACARARVCQGPGEAALPADRAAEARRRLAALEGEAWIIAGDWARAVEPLREACASLGPDDPAASRLETALGRSLYRIGRFDEAEATLQHVMRAAPTTSPDRGPAARILADLALRRGDHVTSASLWRDALETARRTGQPDAEARARRGLAHLLAVDGRLDQAFLELEAAEDLLRAAGDLRVLSSVLARIVELDLAAGRYFAASQRSERLVELADQLELPERSLEAHLSLAEVRLALGQTDAVLAWRRAVGLVEHPTPAGLRLRLARIACDLGHLEEAARLLPAEEADFDDIDDVRGQLAGLRARAWATTRPETARDLAHWCLGRPAGRFVLRQVDVWVDAGRAALAVGDSASGRLAAKTGLRHLPDASADGLRVRLLRLFHAADPDPRAAQALDAVVGRILQEHPPDWTERVRTALTR
jgi:tetratricopeptide (TPR) repeat protein